MKLFFVDLGEQGWVRQKNLSMYLSPSPEGKPALQSHSNVNIHSEVPGGLLKEACRRLRSEGENKVMVHLLRLEQGGKRWCFSKEVANLLPHWGGKDLVNRMLKVKTEEQDGGEVDQEAIVAPN